MSYNISRWITKKIDDLSIPISAFAPISCEEDAWHYADDGTATWEGSAEIFEISGKVQDGRLQVTDMRLFGEGSGWSYQELKEILKQSTGELIATQVWEGGDSVMRIYVINGDVREREVEL